MKTLEATERRVHFSFSDKSYVVKSIVNEKFSLQTELFDSDSYLDRVIQKPWGYEYRIYADQFYDLWKLSLLPGQSTSMHCHPRKETALLCLGGRGTMRFLEGVYEVEPLDCIYIGKGVFHSTENSGDIPLELVEVEVPRNKLDLVRLADKYGRSGKSYETKSLDYSMYVLQHGQLIPGSKMRRACLHNRYHFEVRAGMDILCRPIDNVLFIVPLSVNNAIEHQIQVFPATSIEQQEILLEEMYFVISKNQ